MNDFKGRLYARIMAVGLLFGFCATAQAQSADQKIYYPQVFFDVKETANIMDSGKSTIRGNAFVGGALSKTFKTGQHANKAVVYLFPVTEYTIELKSLRKKHPRHMVAMVPEAYKYHLKTQTDEYGNFQFNGLKPGRYFLEASLNFTVESWGKVQTGNTNYYDVTALGDVYSHSVPMYEYYNSTYEKSTLAEKVIEITQNGQMVDVDLIGKAGVIGGGMLGDLMRGIGKVTAVATARAGSTGAPECYRYKNRLNGICRVFHSNGKVKFEAAMKDDLYQGPLKEYDDSGVLISIVEHEKGKREGKSTFYYPSGKIKQIDHYRDGLAEGEAIAYYENGDVDVKAYYEAGRQIR